MDARRLEDIARTFGVVLLVQFGSTVSGREHAKSDLDLAALLEDPRPSLRVFSDLLHDLQTLSPDRKIDLALINRADPLFLKRIVEQCRLLYGSPRRLNELKMYAFRRFHDHRRYLALERIYVDRALRILAPS
jgi:predicted nucleotidyltransferase